MSISPLNFNGMIQSTNELSHTKAQEDAKPALQQANVSIEVEKKQEQISRQVNDPDNQAEQEYRYDRKGNGSGYRGNQGKKQNKKDDDKNEDGKVIRKPMSSFDIRI